MGKNLLIQIWSKVVELVPNLVGFVTSGYKDIDDKSDVRSLVLFELQLDKSMFKSPVKIINSLLETGIFSKILSHSTKKSLILLLGGLYMAII